MDSFVQSLHEPITLPGKLPKSGQQSASQTAFTDFLAPQNQESLYRLTDPESATTQQDPIPLKQGLLTSAFAANRSDEWAANLSGSLFDDDGNEAHVFLDQKYVGATMEKDFNPAYDASRKEQSAVSDDETAGAKPSRASDQSDHKQKEAVEPLEGKIEQNDGSGQDDEPEAEEQAAERDYGHEKAQMTLVQQATNSIDANNDETATTFLVKETAKIAAFATDKRTDAQVNAVVNKEPGQQAGAAEARKRQNPVRIQVSQATSGVVSADLTTAGMAGSAEKVATEGSVKQIQANLQATGNQTQADVKATGNAAVTTQATIARQSAVTANSNNSQNFTNNGKSNSGAVHVIGGTTGTNSGDSFATALNSAAKAPVKFSDSALSGVVTGQQGQGKPAVTVADQVNVHIRKGINASQDKIIVKLNPQELGRVEIKMEANDQGLIRTMVTAERPETLDLLQRDARSLERSLQESGLKTENGGLNFSLKQEGGNPQSREGGYAQTARRSRYSDDGQDSDNINQDSAFERQGSRHGGDLDIQV